MKRSRPTVGIFFASKAMRTAGQFIWPLGLCHTSFYNLPANSFGRWGSATPHFTAYRPIHLAAGALPHLISQLTGQFIWPLELCHTPFHNLPANSFGRWCFATSPFTTCRPIHLAAGPLPHLLSQPAVQLNWPLELCHTSFHSLPANSFGRWSFATPHFTTCRPIHLAAGALPRPISQLTGQFIWPLGLRHTSFHNLPANSFGRWSFATLHFTTYRPIHLAAGALLHSISQPSVQLNWPNIKKENPAILQDFLLSLNSCY